VAELQRNENGIQILIVLLLKVIDIFGGDFLFEV